MSIAYIFNDLETEARDELESVLNFFIEKKDNWWESKVISGLTEKQMLSSKRDDLKSLDLSALVSVFFHNNRDFLQRGLINSLEYKDLVIQVRFMRNFIAHLPGSADLLLTSEQIIYFLISYKIFFKKFSELHSNDRPKMFDKINNELIKQMMRFLESHEISDIPIELKDDKESNLDSINQKIDSIFSKLNNLKIDTTFSKEQDQERESENNHFSNRNEFSSRISSEEAKDILIGLREEIRRKFRNIPRENGILQNEIIELLIKHKIDNDDKFSQISKNLYNSIDKRQMVHLDEIFTIIKRLKDY